MANPRIQEVLKHQEVLTVADAIELLKLKDPEAILIRNEEGLYFGCTKLFDKKLEGIDVTLGWRVREGKAVIFV